MNTTIINIKSYTFTIIITLSVFCIATGFNIASNVLTVSSTSAATVYPIVDSGQTKYYDTSGEISAPGPGQFFYGQDAQFAGIQPSYALSSDGETVYDNVTMLTWMRGPNTTLATPTTSDKKSFSQAQTWVDTVNAMNYGGFCD